MAGMAIIAAAILIVAVVLFLILYRRQNPADRDRSMPDRSGEQYVGRVFTLSEAIINGIGKVRVDDSTWNVHGDDMPVGTQVRVVGVDGTTLEVVAQTVIFKRDQ